MPDLTATATCTAYRAAVEDTGELVGPRLLAERVGRMAALTNQIAEEIVAARWNDPDLDTLASRLDPTGRRLPSKGWMAIRRLGWTIPAPEGVHVPERLMRTAEEAAARALRLALHRRGIVAAVLATWPADPRRRTDEEWTALRQVLPAGTANAEIRNRTRQVRGWADDHDGRLPAGLTELEPPPRIAAQVLLAAADKHLSTTTRTGEQSARLRVKLPVTATLATRAGWVWHSIDLRLPPTVPPEADLATPTLRPVAGRVRVDLPWRVPVPWAPRAEYTIALGFDWGVNTLLPGAIGKLADTPSGMRVVSDGRRLRFDATSVSAKLHRLRGHRERIAARRDQYTALLAGLPDPDPSGQRAVLEAKHTVLVTEHERVCARIRNLNHALAWAAARWAVDQTVALGATVVYAEDLATLETRGRRKGNARLSGQVRGTLLDALEHLAAKLGVPVVTVPARGTSKYCPRCGTELKHVAAPDRPDVRGWKWAVCGSCGLSCDRDHAAAERIVARGLFGQGHTRTDRKTGTFSISKTADGNVARARRPIPKPKPRRRTRAARRTDRPVLPRCGRRRNTRRERRPPSVQPQPATRKMTKTSRRVPDRRTVPAPVRRQPTGQRPAGQAPQILPLRKGRRSSGPARNPLPRSGRYRPDTGWGFHRNVTVTRVLPLGAFGPAAARLRPARIA